MFVLSIQAKKKWGIVVVAAGVLLLALIVIPKLQPDLSGGIPGETNSQRVTFLAQYGWEVEEEPVEIRDVTIPEEFDQVYQQYGFLCGFAGQGGGSSEPEVSSSPESSGTGESQTAPKDASSAASQAAPGEDSEGSGASAESAGTDVIPDDAWPTD